MVSGLLSFETCIDYLFGHKNFTVCYSAAEFWLTYFFFRDRNGVEPKAKMEKKKIYKEDTLKEYITQILTSYQLHLQLIEACHPLFHYL